MTTRVETVSQCDRCGQVHRRDGAFGSSVPETWSKLTIQYAGASPGMGRRVDKELCLNCSTDTETALGPLDASGASVERVPDDISSRQ